VKYRVNVDGLDVTLAGGPPLRGELKGLCVRDCDPVVEEAFVFQLRRL
jgi:hypothetical protein